MEKKKKVLKCRRNCCRILQHVDQIHDGCIFVAMRLFWEKATWVHQAHDAEKLNLLYIIFGLTHYEKQT